MMSRWLVNYTPPAVIIRLLTINCLIAYLTSWILYLSGASSDPRLLLPAWISITSVSFSSSLRLTSAGPPPLTPISTYADPHIALPLNPTQDKYQERNQGFAVGFLHSKFHKYVIVVTAASLVA
ncbi:hypothetical protein H106_06929 [Trichophyton rubrum CBS 735.88]|nr:hypothetical protein H100_07105 [Trichophyton rubrum MR850]EZG03466.1 hypothetical protein H106_06929 [Trichophyton rubrum CBS 735.88]